MKLERKTVISGKFRYQLYRRLRRGEGAGEKSCCFIMLNPSTADAKADDPTTRRCSSFARRFGCAHLYIVNLFALRTPRPKDLLSDPRAAAANLRKQDRHLLAAASQCDLVIAGWGAIHPKLAWREKEVVERLRSEKIRVFALRFTKNGHPRHPLTLRRDSSQKHFL